MKMNTHKNKTSISHSTSSEMDVDPPKLSCSHKFTLTRLPQPAEELPTPLIFTSNPKTSVFFYVLLQWRGSLRNSLVAGPYNVHHSVNLLPNSGDPLSCFVTSDFNCEIVYFLCSNGSWIHSVWVLPSSAVSYFTSPTRTADGAMLSNSLPRPVDMSPASEVVKLMSYDHGGGGNSAMGQADIDFPMPDSVVQNIPGYESYGFFFKKSDFEKLFKRQTVQFMDSLFQRVPMKERVHHLQPIRIPPDISYLFRPTETLPTSWNNTSRKARAMLEKGKFPIIQEVEQVTPVLGDHAFKVICSVDGGKTFDSAYIRLSLVVDTAKRKNVFNANNDTVDVLMSHMYNTEEETWMDVIARQAAANKKAEAQRRSNERDLLQMEKDIAADPAAELAMMREQIALSRMLASGNIVYTLTIEEQAELELRKRRHQGEEEQPGEEEEEEEEQGEGDEEQDEEQDEDDIPIRGATAKRARAKQGGYTKKSKVVMAVDDKEEEMADANDDIYFD